LIGRGRWIRQAMRDRLLERRHPALGPQSVVRVPRSAVLLLSVATSLASQAPRPNERAARRISLEEVPISARVPLAGSPDWMAVGFGSLWVVNYKPNRVSRIDPTTGNVLDEVPLGGKACLGIAVTADRIWVPTCGTVTINEIDPRTNRLVGRHAVPITVGVEGAFAAEGGSFWLPVSGRDSSSTTIARIDPHTGAIQRLIPVARGSEALAAGFGAVWVASSGTDAVLKIDPAQNRVVSRIPVGRSPKFMTIGEGALWVQNRGDGSVSRVDPRTNREVARIATHAPTPYGDIAVGDGAVWLAVDSTPITRIDARTNAVVYQVAGGSGADAIRVGFGALWVADHEHGELWRIGLAALRAATSAR
jgi:virginiamycin B lyase